MSFKVKVQNAIANADKSDTVHVSAAEFSAFLKSSSDSIAALEARIQKLEKQPVAETATAPQTIHISTPAVEKGN